MDAVSVWPMRANPVMDGAAVLVGTTRDSGRVSHHLTVPGRGSPNVALLQFTLPVKVLGLVKVPFAP